MKTIKETKKLIAILLIYTFLMPTFYSCSKVNMDEGSSINNSLYRKEAKKIINEVDLVEKNLHSTINSRLTSDFEITQELIDEQLVLLGYQEGEISVEMVNEIITKYGVSTTDGIDQLLADYNLTEFTKSSLKSISEGNWIENIIDHVDYNNLEINEKEMLSFINSYGQELDYQGHGRYSFWGLFGAIAGMLVGGLLCSLCIIVGGVLGGVLGSTGGK
ncbi:hypothetical protein FG167_10175 [Lacinutrix sp. WUR7]|uniref:hypothetical protein n=1 Tax=Lacinutrix sp. WUR7 TaxID=2653681 RepID=UPI00193E7A2E|nr:hypothetical protein [Lacinutrix sp. WUR7]QRM89581.1 hypothetical protein FG167_10175 [Lacinutrix sp. WUR7]